MIYTHDGGMPKTYSYWCKDCGKHFELTYGSATEMLDAKPSCPTDPSHSVRRGVPAFDHSGQATACLNALSHSHNSYPHPDFRISRKAKGINRFTKHGVPIIESAKHEREVIAMGDGMLVRD